MRTRFAWWALLAFVGVVLGPWSSGLRAHEIGGVRAADGGMADFAEQGDVKSVREMLAHHVDSNALGHDGTPALHWIVRLQDVSTARQLLRAGPAH